MTDLPRARALVRLDGPGHIMPTEPVTPPDSKAWQVIHLPVMLAIGAVGLLFLAALALGLFGPGVRFVAAVPGARYLVPLTGAAVIIALYAAFVRFVERRAEIDELGRHGLLAEFGLGFAGGLLLSLASFVILIVMGALRIVGFNPPGTMLMPIVLQLATAVTLEIVLCGLGFRLVERWLGSWLALLTTMVVFGTLQALSDEADLASIAAVAIEAALLFAVLFMVTRRLWGPIGLSAAWKIAQIGLYGAATTVTGPYGFVQARLRGPDWLTGGSAGADKSLPALLVNGLAVAVLVAVAVRRGRIVRPAWRRGRTA